MWMYLERNGRAITWGILCYVGGADAGPGGDGLHPLLESSPHLQRPPVLRHHSHRKEEKI